jgi:hypothetical protein
MGNRPSDPAEQVALFRFAVISEAVSPRLSPAERCVIVRALAARSWVTPEGVERSFARGTIDAGPVPRAAGWKRRSGCAGPSRRARRPRSSTASSGPIGWSYRRVRCAPICAGPA